MSYLDDMITKSNQVQDYYVTAYCTKDEGIVMMLCTYTWYRFFDDRNDDEGANLYCFKSFMRIQFDVDNPKLYKILDNIDRTTFSLFKLAGFKTAKIPKEVAYRLADSPLCDTDLIFLRLSITLDKYHTP